MNDALAKDHYYCSCNKSFTGTHCQDTLDCIEDLECQNGGYCDTKHVVGSPDVCACAVGFVGHYCQLSITEGGRSRRLLY